LATLAGSYPARALDPVPTGAVAGYDPARVGPDTTPENLGIVAGSYPARLMECRV